MDLTRIDKGQRLLALQALLHAADLSNPCKKWEIHVQWTHAIVAEFFSQGDLERHVGLEVTERDRERERADNAQTFAIHVCVRRRIYVCRPSRYMYAMHACVGACMYCIFCALFLFSLGLFCLYTRSLSLLSLSGYTCVCVKAREKERERERERERESVC